MPQKKIEIPVVGIWSPLRGYILPIVRKYPDEAKAIAAIFPTETTEFDTGRKRRTPDAAVIEEIVKMLAVIAAEPLGFSATKCTPRGWFHSVFSTAPDLTLAVMTEARKRWKGDSIQQRLWRWMASATRIHPTPNKPAYVRSIFDCVDGELSYGFEFDTGKPVSIDAVVKARQKLARDIRKGIAAHV
jgi:hypothetical protein